MLEYDDLRSSARADPAAVNTPVSRRIRQARVTVLLFIVSLAMRNISRPQSAAIAVDKLKPLYQRTVVLQELERRMAIADTDRSGAVAGSKISFR